MDTMKYIKYKHSLHDLLTQIVIFSPIDSHKDMALQLGINSENIVSAGFFSCNPDSIRCYGDSVTLGVDSQEEDSEKISHIIRGY